MADSSEALIWSPPEFIEDVPMEKDVIDSLEDFLSNRSCRYLVLHTGYTSRLSPDASPLKLLFTKDDLWGKYNGKTLCYYGNEHLAFCQKFMNDHPTLDGYAIFLAEGDAFDALDRSVLFFQNPDNAYCALLCYDCIMSVSLNNDILYVEIDCESG